MNDQYMLLNMDPSEVDFEFAKEEIKKIHGENAVLFSFHESTAGEFYLKLEWPNNFRSPIETLSKLKKMIETKARKL